MDSKRFIYRSFQLSRAIVPVLALLAGFTSAARTVQAMSELYAKSGTSAIFVPLVAGSFAILAEGALYLIALYSEAERIKWRQARKRRHVTTLRTIVRGIAVRLGLREPLPYDQLPETSSGSSLVIALAFGLAITANLFIGTRPIMGIVADRSLQVFLASLVNAPAETQLAFLMDMMGVLFPPIATYALGHWAAKHAFEVSQSLSREHTEKHTIPAGPRVPNQPDGTPIPRGAARLEAYLAEHPEDATLGIQALAKRARVGTSTVQRWRQTRTVPSDTTVQLTVGGNGHRNAHRNDRTE